VLIINRLLCVCAAILISPGAFSGILEHLRPIGAVSGGVGFANVDASANYTVGASNYDYDSHQDTQTRGVWGALLGVELHCDDWQWQTGVSYYQSSPFSSEGILTQDTLEITPDVFEYHFKVRTYQFLWENKLLTEWKERYHPYISVGLGAAINRAENYTTDPQAFYTFTPEYENNTETSFSYSIGAGVDYDVTEHFRVGLGYRITDLGKVGLENSTLVKTELNHSLQKDQWYEQEILLQFTYLM
jgi:opacity protein-like surface antigen